MRKASLRISKGIKEGWFIMTNKLNSKFLIGITLGLAAVIGTGLTAGINAAPNDSFAPVNAFIPDKNYKPDLSGGADNFYKSQELNSKKVTFKNLFDMNVTGILFTPKNMIKGKKYSAIVVSHPMGAVKEQSANLYAQKMAEKGFVTLSIDLSYWGESSGTPRNSVLPDLYAESFSAAVDYLGTRDFIDKNKIGAIGICGSGSFAISAAKIDPRIKAVTTISMYNMGNASRHGLNNALSLEQRKEIIKEAAEQRYVEFLSGEKKYTSGTVDELKPDANDIEKEFYDYYRTKRGAYGNEKTTTHPTLSSNTKFMNFYPFENIETISPRALLFVTGDEAHSKEFSEDAYKRAAEPKELYYVKGAGHVDLYDRVNLIPFDKIDSFFKEYLK